MKNWLLILFMLLSVWGSTQVESEVAINVHQNDSVRGTLLVPEHKTEETDLVILIAGSGPTDRDGNNQMMTNNALKMIAEMLVENGYACLRYDKRMIGESKLTDFAQKDLSFDHFVSDASAWVDKFSSQFDKIILAGHSQGSLVALIAANQSENVDGVISIAGAGRPIHEILKTQLAPSLSVEMRGLVDAKLDTLAMGDTLVVTPDMLHSIMHPTIQPFLISWMKYKPAEEIKKLSVPVLVINGSTDIQIPISEAKLLTESNKDAKLVVIKNMNHVLKKIKLTTQSEQLEVYGNPDIPLHKKLPKTILKFLSSIE